ncbi:MFS general substrate transporter [Xylariaceae sp. AK1471]|nr:MFS general substrate transporter [Xylariaceae sp. AK1471]
MATVLEPVKLEYAAESVVEPIQLDVESNSIIADSNRGISVAPIPRWRVVSIIGSVCLMSLLSTTLSGILAVALPKIAEDIDLKDGLLLWPASVYSLASGSTLLFFGSLSDVVGSKASYIVGSFFSAVWILACGLSRTGVQLIVFRAIHGTAISMCLPSSISILTANFPTGKLRNAAFACLGAAQPMGFLIGLIIGGILTDLVSWRLGFYIVAGINAFVLVVSVFCVPNDTRQHGLVLQRFRDEIDWIGVLVISTALGLLSYVLASITIDLSSIRKPANISLLVISVLLFPCFALWVHNQEKSGRPALIPNSLWRNSSFVSVNALCFLGWATVTANQYFLALFFEEVQLESAFATSLRFLPLVVSGVLANVVAGLLVRHVHAKYLVAGAVTLSAITPLLMALVNPTLTYWAMEFPATFLSPIAADIVLVVANLTITSIFPPETHGLAGGVTNTVAQLGTTFGLNLTAILATAVTQGSKFMDKSSPDALLVGYRASFWASFGATTFMLLIIAVGMRKVGKVGTVKAD